ncbi:MAG: hypothetical protein LBV12_01355, partial [Puniceicoccales bacterium]|nr:hypothetical protein [Puniceicoccales bacterium]
MPWQLVYTSVPSGLVPGRSGFCTAARHRGIPERLVAAIERMSVYEPPAETGRPVIFCYRTVSLGSDTYGVITRFCDAGLDYTSRRNYLAHHLIFNSMEMAMLPPPEEIARRWPLWHSVWNEAARWLTDDTDTPISLRHPETTLPAKTWAHFSGDSGNAASLCPNADPVDHVLSRKKLDDDALLHLFAESSLLVRGGPWSVGFTTCIQETDTPSQTPWRAGTGLPTIDPLSMGPAAAITPVIRHARTGVPPDQQPQAAASPIFGGSPRKSRATLDTASTNRENAQTESTSSRSSNHALILGIAGVSALLICLGAWFVINSPGQNDDIYSPPPRQQQTTTSQSGNSQGQITTTPGNSNISSIYATEALRNDLNVAIAASNWLLAADLWKKLLAEAPEVAAKQRSSVLPLIQAQLAPALADSLEKQFDLLAPQFNQTDIDAFSTALTEAKDKLKETGAQQSTVVQSRFRRLERQLTLLSALPLDIPPLAFVSWKSGDSQDESTESTALFTSKKLREFLQKKQLSLEFNAQPFEAWDKSDAEVISGIIGPKDYQAGKALFVRASSQQTPCLRLIIERRNNQISIVRISSGEATPLQNLLDSGKNIRLNFITSGAGKKTTGQILLNPSSPPKPIRSSIEVLSFDETTGILSIPAWLRSALGRFELPNGLLILYPAGGADFGKQYTGSSITRNTVEHALRSGILAS